MKRANIVEPSRLLTAIFESSGEVSEWSKERDWKSRRRQNRLAGSNPALSAIPHPSTGHP
jgi:hypothetical protein